MADQSFRLRAAQGEGQRLLRLLALLILWICAGGARAEPLLLDSDMHQVPLGQHVQILEDRDRQLGIDEVSGPAYAAHFFPSHTNTPNFGFTSSAYWVRLDLLYRADNPHIERDWLLELAFPPLDEVDLYTAAADGSFVHVATGDQRPFGTRAIDHQHYVFTIPTTAGVPTTVFLRVQTEGSLQLPLTLWSVEGFAESVTRTQFGSWAFYGAMLAMLFYNLLLFLSVRDRTYLYYCAYLLAFITLWFSIGGLAAQHLWPDWTWWTNRSVPVFLALMVFSVTLFARSFLRTAIHTPRLDKVLTGVMAIALILTAASLVIAYNLALKLGVLAVMLAYPLLLVAGLLCWRRGVRMAWLFVLAWVLPITGAMAYALKTGGVLPASFLTHHGIQIGAMVEVVLLSLGLADRINTERHERYLAERRAAEHLRHYRNMFEHALEGIYQSGTDDRFIKANPALAQMFGYETPQELIDSVDSVAALFDVPAESIRELARHLRESGHIMGFEVRAFRRDGTSFWASMSARAVMDETGWVLHYEGSILDITDRRERDQAKREREWAEAATEAKSSFLANVSHEIRTPMNAIMGFTGLLRRTELSHRQADYTDKIEVASRNLLGIINDVLDLSKIEAGRMALEHTAFTLPEVLNNVADLFAGKAADKDLDLLIDVDDAVPVALLGDPLRLSQILVNLVGNAVKFTAEGEVELSVSLQEAAGEALVLRFSVRDTGIGIAPEKLERLFSPFYQGDESTTRTYGGTGLGLSICRQLAEMMGGRIDVDSTVGAGSTFHFTVRVATDPAGAPLPALPAVAQATRTLIVDDHRASRDFLQRVLVRGGMTSDAVGSAEAAVERIVLSAKHRPYDLVLVDARIAGSESLVLLRNLQRHQTHPLRCILLTSFGDEALRLQTEADDSYRFLAKPLTRFRLLDALRGIESSPPPAPSVSGPDFTGSRVLLVEDNIINQQLAAEILRSTGLAVDIAADGEEAVAQVTRQRYDAVLMDVQMPVLDGFAATRRIRGLSGFEQLPIIAMTANAMMGDREACLDAGMTDYIIKPIDRQQLFSVLAHWLAPRPGAQPPAEASLPDTLLADDLPGIDFSDAVQRLGGNRELLIKLVIAFGARYADAADTLMDALRAGDLETAQRIAHTIKSVAGNLSAKTLQQAALELEMALKEGLTSIDQELANFGGALGPVLESATRLRAASDADPVLELG